MGQQAQTSLRCLHWPLQGQTLLLDRSLSTSTHWYSLPILLGDPAINLLVGIICLFVYLVMFGGVYKIWLLNVLEYFLLLNLVILSVAMLYTTIADKPSHILPQASVSITLCTTILIVAYHVSVVILKALRMDPKITAIWRNKTDNQLPRDEMQQHNAMLKPPVTCTFTELKEPLLEYRHTKILLKL